MTSIYGTVTLLVTVKVTPEGLPTVRDALREVIPAARQEDGCLL